MPRTAIATVEMPLPQRAGALVQLAAVAPFARRATLDAWQWDRLPYSRHLLYAGGARAALLTAAQTREQAQALAIGLGSTAADLPPAAPGTFAGTLGAARPATTPLPANLTGGAIARQDSAVLALEIDAVGDDVYAISTPSIPYPARITSLRLHTLIIPTTGARWQLYLTDVPYDGIANGITGVPLLPVYLHTTTTPSTWNSTAEFGPLLDTWTGEPGQSMVLPGAGRDIIPAGKYLTFALRDYPTAPPDNISTLLYVTWQEILPERAAPVAFAAAPIAIEIPTVAAVIPTAAPAERSAAAAAAAELALETLRTKQAAELELVEAKSRAALALAAQRAETERQAALDQAARNAAAAAARAAAAADAAAAAAAARERLAAIDAQSQIAAIAQRAAQDRALAEARAASTAATAVARDLAARTKVVTIISLGRSLQWRIVLDMPDRAIPRGYSGIPVVGPGVLSLTPLDPEAARLTAIYGRL